MTSSRRVWVDLVGVAALAACLGAGVTAQAGLDGEGYKIEVGGGKAKVGQPSAFPVVVKAKDGYKVNDKYPTKISFKDAPADVELPKKELKGADGKMAADQKSLSFDVPFTLAKAGTYKVEGELKFSVCNDKSCIIQKQAVKATLAAK
jgi:hypothetical protein